MMVLKPTIIGFSAICPLSPWERAKPNNLKKTSSEKMTTQKYAVPKPPKEKHKKQLLPNTFQTPLPTKTDTHRLTKTYRKICHQKKRYAHPRVLPSP